MAIPAEPAKPDYTRSWGFPATDPERQELWELDRLLGSARNEVVKFRSCIALADIAFHHMLTALQSMGGAPTTETTRTEMNMFSQWANISAHSAIGTLYHFKEFLDAIVSWADKSDARKYVAEARSAKAAEGLFLKHFPKWKVSRHATAHHAEIGLHYDENAHRGGSMGSTIKKAKGTSAMVQDGFENRTFVTTRRGEMLRFDITWENYQRFTDVYHLLLNGMQPPPRQQPEDQTFHQP